MNGNGGEAVEHRSDDKANIKPTRVVSLWTVLGVATPFIIGGLTAINNQIEQNAMRRQLDLQVVEKLAELKADMKALTEQVAAKNVADAQQTADIRDLDRRLTRIESSR
jgi:hypothetical protein